VALPRVGVRGIGTWVVTLLASALLLIPVGAALQVVLTAQVDDRAPTQALVVLNPARTWGDPDEARMSRLDQAAALYRSGVAPVVVIAGPERVERVSRDYLMTVGVPDRDIVMFPTGSDTVGALGVVARVLRDLGWSSATIVTDPAHAARAQATASAYGIDAHMSPAQEQVALTSDGVGREVMALLRHYAWTRWSLPEILA
jgi:uncharacterized SAM-binding protein YcdF (DUF218 family)